MIYTEDLWKTYDMGSEQQVHALRGVNLRIQRNEYVAIMGPSGSGKSTLMNLIGCLDSPSKGQYWLNGQLVSELTTTSWPASATRKSALCSRPSTCWPARTALHNVELPLIYAGMPPEQRSNAQRSAGCGRHGSAHDSQAERTLRRSAAARRHRAGAGQQVRPSSWPTSRRATWIRRPATKSWRCWIVYKRKATPSSWLLTNTISLSTRTGSFTLRTAWSPAMSGKSAARSTCFEMSRG